MDNRTRKIMITSALPYANGDIHIGHLVEYLQTDIWKRFQLLRGNTCYYICGSDAHGTGIMLNAEKAGITPETMVRETGKAQLADFEKFHIAFDYFSSTDSTSNQKFAEQFYLQLKKNNDITCKTIKQAFDPEKNLFLPDRFIKGECPKCGAAEQYGDNCEACGATYSPTDLKNPKSVISGSTPIEKESEHYFFELAHYTEKLKIWLASENIQDEVRNKLNEWFEHGLQAWDISRDAPYFGFVIPETDNKYFYVWFDAPIGYISAFYDFCQQQNINFDEYWRADSQTELHHFVGKDVVYFHTLFWPAMLMGNHYRLPSSVNVHGMLTVNGEKMSKSRGTFIKAKTFSEHINPECLRYYFAAKLSNQIVDIDLNLEDFRLRVNADLVNKVINIASRCASFIYKKFDKTLAARCCDDILWQQAINASDTIAQHYEQRDYSKALKAIIHIADLANQYIDKMQPWVTIKDENLQQQTHEVCTLGLNLFKVIMTYLQPIIPTIAEASETFLNYTFTWKNHSEFLMNHEINAFKPLLQRVEQQQLDDILIASQQDLQKNS